MPEQRVALITGATSGIGLGIARAFAAQGTIVAFSGFASAEEISRIVSELNAAGGKAEHVPADAQDPLELAALVRQCEAKFGSVDILVNCAGIQHVAPIEEFPVAQWDAIIAVNLSSAFHTIRAALPGMRRRNWGRIVNIASVHGLVGLTKVVALETAGSPITCNAICPGWVHTPLVQKQVDSRAKELGVGISQAERLLLQEKQPSLQFVGIDEVAALVLFVASDAAREVRGAAWTIDGGWTAQ
jgi:3-hydroxybutyrate dehydrogenase